MKFWVAVCVLGLAILFACASETEDYGQHPIGENDLEKREVELGIHSGYGVGTDISGGHGANALDENYSGGHDIGLSGGYEGGYQGGDISIATSGHDGEFGDIYKGGNNFGFGGGYGGELGFGRIESHKVEIEKSVPIPHYKAVTIPQPVRIEIPHPVAIQIPHPVPIKIPVPVPVIKGVSVPVEKEIPYPIFKPYAIKIEKTVLFPVPKPFPIPVPIVKVKHVFHAPTKDTHKSYRKYYGGTYHF